VLAVWPRAYQGDSGYIWTPFPGAQLLGFNWDDAASKLVSEPSPKLSPPLLNASGTECVRCHQPLRQHLQAICTGDDGTVVRIGDDGYKKISEVSEPSPVSPPHVHVFDSASKVSGMQYGENLPEGVERMNSLFCDCGHVAHFGTKLPATPQDQESHACKHENVDWILGVTGKCCDCGEFVDRTPEGKMLGTLSESKPSQESVLPPLEGELDVYQEELVKILDAAGVSTSEPMEGLRGRRYLTTRLRVAKLVSERDELLRQVERLTKQLNGDSDGI